MDAATFQEPRPPGRGYQQTKERELVLAQVLRTALTALLVTAAAAEAAGSDSAATRPATSVVLMLIDNVGYGDLGCYGNQLIKTPHIDRLARQPFFVYLPFSAAHYPNLRSKQPGQPCIWQAPAKHFQSYGYSPDEQDPKKRYRAVITALDAGIGRVINQLDALGETRDLAAEKHHLAAQMHRRFERWAAEVRQ